SAIVNALPPFTNAPTWASMTYGNPNFAYSYTRGPAFLNQNGLFVSTDVFGVAGHAQASGSHVYAVWRNTDGSLSTAGTLVGSSESDYSGGQVAQVLDLNNKNQVLGVTSGSFFGDRKFLLVDTVALTVTDLQTLVPDWHIEWGPRLDDQGRLLVNVD